VRLVSYEKFFTVDKKRNCQNDKWICKDVLEVFHMFRTKNPASVMVLGAVSSHGHVMPPHFFKPKVRINKEAYLEVLKDVVKPWMDNVASLQKVDHPARVKLVQPTTTA